MEWVFGNILELTESSFLLTAIGAITVAGLELKGQFIETQMGGDKALLFMGSVRLSCLEDMKKFGLYLSDTPRYGEGLCATCRAASGRSRP